MIVFFQLKQLMLEKHGCTVPWMPDSVLCTAKNRRGTQDEVLSTYNTFMKTGQIADLCTMPCGDMNFAMGQPDISSDTVRKVQSLARRRSPGLVNSVAAVAYPFWLALPAAFAQPEDQLLAGSCNRTCWTTNIPLQMFTHPEVWNELHPNVPRDTDRGEKERPRLHLGCNSIHFFGPESGTEPCPHHEWIFQDMFKLELP